MSSAIATRPVPLAVYQRAPGRTGRARAPLVAAVVEMVRVAVPGVTFTTPAETKLNVGRSCAPAGLDMMAAVSVTLPVKPSTDVTVMVEEFPVVAPGLTDTGVPISVKVGVSAAVTVTELTPVAEL